MKIKTLIITLAALGLLGSQVFASPMGTAFTYQGQLTTGMDAAKGLYDFSFALFDSSGGGLQQGPTLTLNAVGVSNGYFSVTLDFGAAFQGEARWLAISVKTNGASSYTPLTPRQALTPTPYAVMANSSSNLLGALPAASVGALQLAAGAVGNTALASAAVTSDKVADGTIVNADIAASGIDGSKILGGDLQAYRLKVGSGHTLSGGWATIAGGVGSLATGNRAVVGGGDLNEATNNHSTVSGGNRNKAYGDASTVSGGNVNSAGGDGSTVSGGNNNSGSGAYSTVSGGDGNVASGADATVGGGAGNQATMYASTIGGGSQNVALNNAATIGGGSSNTNNGSASTIAGGQVNTLAGDYSSIGGGGANNISGSCSTIAGGYLNSATATSSTVAGGYWNTASGGDSTVGGGNLNNASGHRATVPGGWNNRATGDYSFAAGQSAVASAAGSFVFSDNSGNAFTSTTANEFAVRALNGVRVYSDVGIHLNAVNRPLIVRDWDVFTGSAPDGKAGIGRWGLFMEPYAMVIGIPNTDVGPRYMEVARYNTDGTREKVFGVGNDGTTTVKVLTITGGADLAEPFETSDLEPVPKGSVMVIDDQNPGRLRVSTAPYDKRVAGVVSGAGGLNPGLTIAQQGVTDHGAPVALSGRVYTLTDACNGPIQPGDLLTTAGTPGHAMKVTEPSAAQGAIIGKAMSSLKRGRGLVLVLVTLQ